MQRLQSRVAARVSSSRRGVIVSRRRNASFSEMERQLSAASASLKRHGRKAR